jgi:hypothetical protein
LFRLCRCLVCFNRFDRVDDTSDGVFDGWESFRVKAIFRQGEIHTGKPSSVLVPDERDGL